MLKLTQRINSSNQKYWQNIRAHLLVDIQLSISTCFLFTFEFKLSGSLFKLVRRTTISGAIKIRHFEDEAQTRLYCACAERGICAHAYNEQLAEKMKNKTPLIKRLESRTYDTDSSFYAIKYAGLCCFMM